MLWASCLVFVFLVFCPKQPTSESLANSERASRAQDVKKQDVLEQTPLEETTKQSPVFGDRDLSSFFSGDSATEA